VTKRARQVNIPRAHPICSFLHKKKRVGLAICEAYPTQYVA
jgi:hypothetical protein